MSRLVNSRNILIAVAILFVASVWYNWHQSQVRADMEIAIANQQEIIESNKRVQKELSGRVREYSREINRLKRDLTAISKEREAIRNEPDRDVKVLADLFSRAGYPAVVVSR